MWEKLKLADVCTLRNGRAYKKPELLAEGKYRVLRVGNFFTSKNWYYSDLELDDTKYCDNGDLLYAWSASFGARLWEGEKVIYHYHIWRVDINEEIIDKRFLFYWFEFDKELIKLASGTGTTMMHVSKSSMEKREIHLPPLAEQQRIVAKLDAAFTEIDMAIEVVKNKMIEISSLYENSITAEFINIDDCVEKKLSDVCEKITDGTHQTPKYFEEGYIFLSSKNVTSRKIDWENVRYIDESQHIQMQKRIAPRVGDVLLAKNGTTGVAAIVDRDVVFDIYVSLAWLRSKGDVLPEYLLEYVNSKMAREQFNTRTKGIGVPNLHLQEIREVVIRFPKDKEKQKIIVKKLKNIDDACNSYKQLNEQKLQSLVSLKSAILAQELQSEAA